MIKKMPFFLLTISLTLALTAISFPRAMDAQSENAKSVHQDKIQGTITKVNAAGGTVTILKIDNMEQTLMLDSNTAIKVNGKEATVADLKPGQEGTIVAEGQNAISVEVSNGNTPPT